MITPLLTTKLYVPRARLNLVPRPRLIERLRMGLNRKLTLISAPAGFGKTTLLSECVVVCEQLDPTVRVAWVSLDDGDNDPTRFWTYLIAALQTVRDGVGTAALAALQTPQGVPGETLIAQLVNEFANLAEPVALILDDLHAITNPQINEELVFLVEYLPPNWHLVVSSRADPPWPLARWRVRNQICELRTDDLRFTPLEATSFLNDAMGLDLSTEDIAVLDARTEGWIAGLQLAALSMQGRDASSFVRAFSGSHRFVLDYLVEEVLDRQPAGIQEFLLQTSILARLTASLCDALRFGFVEGPSDSEGAFPTGRSDSQIILERLEEANLFLVALDDERRWYRYHHLFADLLQSRLEQVQRDRLPTLHLRASVWYERNGLISEAVGHALAAGDVKRVATLAERNVLAMMDHGELTAMAGWLDALPAEITRSQPWLGIAQAWPLAYAGQGDAVESLLRDAEQALVNRVEVEEAERRRIAGHLAAIRACVVGGRGDLAGAIEHTNEALALLPEGTCSESTEGDLMARGWAAYYTGFMLRMKGDLEAAAQALGEAAVTSQAAGDSHVAMLALGELGVLRFQRGQLHEAAATYRKALALADDYASRGGRQLPARGYLLARLSAVLREWNELEAAVQQARDGLALCEQWQQADALLEAHLHLARALQASGDPEGALQAVCSALQVAGDTSPWFSTYTQAQAVRLWLSERPVTQDRAALVSDWVQKSALGAGDEFSFQYELMYRVLAQVLIEQGELDKGLGLLARLLDVVEGAGAMGHAIEIIVLQAMALQVQGNTEQALAALAPALAIAEPEGYVRTFIDEGRPMARLLRRAVIQGISVEYATRLLAAMEPGSQAGGPMAVPGSTVPRSARPIAEPLSPRETEVLRLLTTHLSHAEIAQELVVSVNTVRSHVKSIYGKLDVHSRLEAIQRARELRLLG